MGAKQSQEEAPTAVASGGNTISQAPSHLQLPPHSHHTHLHHHHSPHVPRSGNGLVSTYSHPQYSSQRDREREGDRERERERQRERQREGREREREREQSRRLHQLRREYVQFDFMMPSLDQRLVPRSQSVMGTNHDPGSRSERRHRSHHSRRDGSLSASAPANSILFVRGLAKMQCPLCSKEVMSSDFEEHLIICMTKPRVSYNVDTLTQDVGECSICLDDMLTGDRIARLPCLCVYHMKCLQQWYTVSQTCPKHPESNYT